MNTLVFVIAGVLAGCSSRDTTPPAPAQAQEANGASLTADQCTAAGGEVVGDIGDGAIHRPEYRCPRSGQPPIGHIRSEPDEPMAIEGSVCCR